MFNTLRYAKRLERTGLTREQAESQVDVIAEMIMDGVATRQDLNILKIETQKEFEIVRKEMAQEFAAVRAEMTQEFKAVRYDINRLEHRLTVLMGVMFTASTTITITVLTFLK